MPDGKDHAAAAKDDGPCHARVQTWGTRARARGWKSEKPQAGNRHSSKRGRCLKPPIAHPEAKSAKEDDQKASPWCDRPAEAGGWQDGEAHGLKQKNDPEEDNAQISPAKDCDPENPNPENRVAEESHKTHRVAKEDPALRGNFAPPPTVIGTQKMRGVS
ncbi:hypothetical protein GCM10008941_07090 [Rhizomicrobium palustre]